MAKLFSYIFLLMIVVLLYQSSSSALTTYNVLSFGARGNGVTDSTQAFISAWSAACASTGPTRIYVPKGRYFLGSVAFNGDCKSSEITLQIDGTLIAPADYHVLGQFKNWVSFDRVNRVSIIGGAFDAKGSALWTCKAGAATNCPEGATTLRITNSTNIRINGLVSLNSQLYHIVIDGCQNVNIEGVMVIASGESPNTDGIHIEESTNVAIMNSVMKTGDDCISIGPGTTNLWIERVTCGPGHGISIGSLGQDMKEDGVQNVTVKNTTFIGTQNGLRIKTWARPSNGFVQGVQFIGAFMYYVENPIVIDQSYCPHDLNCPDQVSGIQISDVTFQDIRGVSTAPIAIKFDCSVKFPCKGIKLQNVNLKYLKQEAQSSCTNVIGEALGLVKPDGCL
ncbi:hypothetical protein EZV62_000435 [Acer yangbiense]|uniref:Pectate lyase superfamily protein domain-containing protein n=1 Tax=Acer yangbiense TaxID=1000413 RepID=A0A5C7ITZ9_9ROSI|nr:hypothetical protein EZV62_000435 [Acer yangbiense]